MQQLSRDKFDRFPRVTTESTLCVLDRYGLRDHWPAGPTLTPQIRFLYIASRFCSTFPSDPTSRRCPCASLSLHLCQVVKRTFTSKRSNMLGVPRTFGSPEGEPSTTTRPTLQQLCEKLWTPPGSNQSRRMYLFLFAGRGNFVNKPIALENSISNPRPVSFRTLDLPTIPFLH
jgi:hypothetical protein